MTIGWLIVLFAAAIALLIVGSNAYYRAITRRMHAKLDDITAIYETDARHGGTTGLGRRPM